MSNYVNIIFLLKSLFLPLSTHIPCYDEKFEIRGGVI